MAVTRGENLENLTLIVWDRGANLATRSIDGYDYAAVLCFGVHRFGAQPVDMAKSADRQTVLAQVSWGYHESFGCYLALDPAATDALRAAHT
ncbi:hypothetical protein [Candidatus Poriferisocius sp.]|uniref:hypothetical protein n=1 Tax=Candidatus Poriferisocius sp. TaxID=3101276 RepID=UPI003B5298A2